jgi:hypothetical protein
MVGSRTVRIATIAVWTLAIAVVVALAFVRGTAPVTVTPLRVAGGALPVMYEFSTST